MIRPRDARLINMSDVELAEHMYELIDAVAPGDDELQLRHELYGCMREAFERFAPDAERAVTEVNNGLVGESLETYRRAFRDRQGARMIQSSLAEGNDG